VLFRSQDAPSGRHYIVMEYVEGPSCADLLRQHRMFDAEDTVRIVRDACHGLDYAHRAGVIHRDVKPGNLLVASESGTTKLADFGIAKAAEQTRITQVGSVLGTAAYLSPEQARGDEAGPASDIYSLGVCAYQFLAGRLPHEYGSLTELALKQQQEPVAPITDVRQDVTPELDRAVRASLERDPARRYSSALEMATALESGLRGEATAATQRLDDATNVLAAGEATRMLGRTEATRALPREPIAPPSVMAPARHREPAPRKQRNPLRWIIGILIALLLGAAVALALGLDDGARERIQEDDAQEQIDKLIEYVREHRE
jgi:serine/threonine protein kinase